MPEVSATDASRNFADLLDAVEHDGASFTIVRRGKVIAELHPAALASGAKVKDLLRRHRADDAWADEVAALRSKLEPEERF